MAEENSSNQSNELPLRVLIIDDDPSVTTVLEHIVSRQGWNGVTANSLSQAKALLASIVPDVALIDVYIGEQNGLEFVPELRRRIPDIGIIVISGEDTDSLAKNALDSGADFFLSKPIAPNALLLSITKLGELRKHRCRTVELEHELERAVSKAAFPEIVTQSDGMKAVLNLVTKVSQRDLPVLVCGESGTGKELIARAVHQRGPRGKSPFVELNCAALPANLVESELFGHEKGAFTGAIATRVGKMEQASGGTLFLDEIGELPLEIQPKFLRALQEKQITRVGGKNVITCDFRLVTATNKDLVEEVKKGNFREDLFYRVAVFPMKLPTLRERPEDLGLLLAHFFKQEGMPQIRLAPRAWDLIASYRWPGNVRELKNFAQAMTLYAEDNELDEHAILNYFGSRLGGAAPARALAAPAANRSVRKLADLEREEIIFALALFHGDVSKACEALGMGRATLYKYLKRHDINPKALPSDGTLASPE